MAAYAIFVALSAEQHSSVWMDPALWILASSGEAGEEQGHLNTSMVTRYGPSGNRDVPI